MLTQIKLLVLAFVLSGCASYYDSQDPCQTEPYPSFCGASMNNVEIMVENGEIIIENGEIITENRKIILQYNQ